MKEPSKIFSGNMLKINEQNQISSQPLAFQKEPNLLSLIGTLGSAKIIFDIFILPDNHLI